MERSGYSKSQRGEIMDRGLRGYEKLRRLDREGKRPLHRRGVDTLHTRFRKKLTGKTSWYKEKKKTDLDLMWESPSKKAMGKINSAKRSNHKSKEKKKEDKME